MTESRYYEDVASWKAERYLANQHELRRLEMSASLIPDAATTLLDAGTGNGAFLRVIETSRPNLHAVGVERSAAAISSAVCQSSIGRGSIDNLPFASRAFDAVSALEVVEHLPFGTFEKALAELERVSAKWVLISVPYRENRLFVKCPYCSCSFNPHYHMRRFNDHRMRTLMPTFHCIRLETIKSPYAIGGELFTPLARWLRARTGFFPRSAVCPQCGYSIVGSERTDQERLDYTSASLQAARGLFPTRMRAKWIVGLYKREEAGD